MHVCLRLFFFQTLELCHFCHIRNLSWVLIQVSFFFLYLTKVISKAIFIKFQKYFSFLRRFFNPFKGKLLNIFLNGAFLKVQYWKIPLILEIVTYRFLLLTYNLLDVKSPLKLFSICTARVRYLAKNVALESATLY